MDKYKLTGLNRAGDRVTIAVFDSLIEAHMEWNWRNTTRGLRRYRDIAIEFP
jgi:hypothetical protein